MAPLYRGKHKDPLEAHCFPHESVGHRREELDEYKCIKAKARHDHTDIAGYQNKFPKFYKLQWWHSFHEKVN
jgi:hypothetical protein